MKAPFLRLRRLGAFAGGVAVVSLTLLAASEFFLRRFPPRDFRPYLGDDSGLTGPFRADNRFGVQYRSWEEFEENYQGRIDDLRDVSRSPRCWAMFGSSFVHMVGALADITRASLPGRPVFNLGRNELPFIRAAQIQLLLDHGMKPERIFFVLIPGDASPLTTHSLSQIHVTSQGGIAYTPHVPDGSSGAILSRCRLGMLAWVRTGRHQAVPMFPHRYCAKGVPPGVLADLRQILMGLGEVSRRHAVPITVVLLPDHQQILRGVKFGLQDQVSPICREAGLDACDVRQPFLEAEDKKNLFIPDKHYSERGNRLLLTALLAHLSDDTSPRQRMAGKGGKGP